MTYWWELHPPPFCGILDCGACLSGAQSLDGKSLLNSETTIFPRGSIRLCPLLFSHRPYLTPMVNGKSNFQHNILLWYRGGFKSNVPKSPESQLQRKNNVKKVTLSRLVWNLSPLSNWSQKLNLIHDIIMVLPGLVLLAFNIKSKVPLIQAAGQHYTNKLTAFFSPFPVRII